METKRIPTTTTTTTTTSSSVLSQVGNQFRNRVADAASGIMIMADGRCAETRVPSTARHKPERNQTTNPNETLTRTLPKRDKIKKAKGKRSVGGGQVAARPKSPTLYC